MRVLVHFFSLPLIFTLVGASISYFPTAATKFSCCFSNRKNVSFVFYLSLCLSLLFSLSFAGLSPTFSFSLSPSSLYSKFVDMTINLSLILSRTRIQKKFRLYWLFSWLCFTRREWLCDFRQKNLKLPYLCVDWVIFTLVYLWWGRMVGRAGVRSRDYQNFLDAQVTKFSYPRCSAARERALLISRR